MAVRDMGPTRKSTPRAMFHPRSFVPWLAVQLDHLVGTDQQRAGRQAQGFRGLITSSTLVLCWMGRSAGLAPRRIFPTCPSLNRSRRRLRLRTMTGHHAHLRAVFAVKAATAASATAAATTTAASTATWDEPASGPLLVEKLGTPRHPNEN
jgi:hypothetical protein